jgi:hypothetical protein
MYGTFIGRRPMNPSPTAMNVRNIHRPEADESIAFAMNVRNIHRPEADESIAFGDECTEHSSAGGQ